MAAASDPLPTLNHSFATFQPTCKHILIDWLLHDYDCRTWFVYRCWALVRMSGCWPLPLWGHTALPVTLCTCIHCGTREVDIRHALCNCPGTDVLRQDLLSKVKMPPVSNEAAFLLCLFRDGSNLVERLAYVQFVGAVISSYVQPSCDSALCEA